MYIHVYVYLRVEVVVVAAHIYVVASGVYLSSFFLLSPSFDVVSGALNGLLTRVVKDTQAHARLDADKMYAICLPRSTVCVCVCIHIHIYVARSEHCFLDRVARVVVLFSPFLALLPLSLAIHHARGMCRK